MQHNHGKANTNLFSMPGPQLSMTKRSICTLRPDKSILLGLHYLKQHFRMPTWPSSPQSWLRFLWRRYFQKTCNGEKESFKQYRIMPPVTNPKASNNRSELEKNYHLWQIHKLSTNQELKEFNYITINITFYKKMAGHCAFRS